MGLVGEKGTVEEQDGSEGPSPVDVNLLEADTIGALLVLNNAELVGVGGGVPEEDGRLRIEVGQERLKFSDGHDFPLLMVLYTTVDVVLHRSPLDRTVLPDQASAMNLVAAAGFHERDPDTFPVLD